MGKLVVIPIVMLLVALSVMAFDKLPDYFDTTEKQILALIPMIFIGVLFYTVFS